LRIAVWTGVTRDTRPTPVAERRNTVHCSNVSLTRVTDGMELLDARVIPA
jgi:hypothetical protein